jgi:hypothetical protein
VSRLRGEAGFTVIELMVALTVGLGVLFALLGLLDTSTRLSASAVDRVETTSRARLTMDLVSRQVRSQLCLGTDLPALTAASPTSMTFYGSLAPEASPLIVQRRTLTYDAVAKRLVETVWTGAGVRPNVTFDTAPQTSVVADGIVPSCRPGARRRPRRSSRRRRSSPTTSRARCRSASTSSRSAAARRRGCGCRARSTCARTTHEPR